MKLILMLGLIFLSGCATHSVILGEFIIHGSNEHQTERVND
jgi:hypothetical protein